MAFTIQTTTLQDAVTATGTGTTVDGKSHLGHRFRVRCTGGSATVALQAKQGSAWDTLEDLSFTGGGTELREVTGPYEELRANVTAISGGATVTVVLEQYYDTPRGATL